MGSACGFREKAYKELKGLAFDGVFASFFQKEEIKKREFVVYLRFLKACFPSMSVMCSNPVSMSFLICSGVVANSHMKSSVMFGRSWRYFCVELRLLCPSCFITVKTLFVWCSVVVAFQCLKVCRCT